MVGTELFATDWRRVDRGHLDMFHWAVDEVADTADMSANVEFPRAADNVDGFMLVALTTSAFFNNFPIGGDGLVAWNYGLDKVRFPATVYLENRIRLRTTLEAAEGRGEGWLLRNLVTIDIEGSTRPAMVGGWLVMFTPNVG